MKKTLLLTLLALLGMTQAVAQEYEYVPFVREGVKWVYFYNNPDGGFYPPRPDLAIGKVYLTLEFKGDTVINGKTYKAMHKYYGDAINEENDTVRIYMREENKVVYGYVPEGKYYADCPIGVRSFYCIYYSILDGEEFVLYDFNDPATFLTELIYNEQDEESPYPCIYNTLSLDTISVGNHRVRRFNLSTNNSTTIRFFIIEGIGFDFKDPCTSGYTLFPLRPVSMSRPYDEFALSHVIEDGEIIYKATNYDEPNAIGEVVADGTRRPLDANYYNLMGQPVGKDVPTVPGIYIHQGKKIVVR